jgi:predicted Zn-dependent peptidase
VATVGHRITTLDSGVRIVTESIPSVRSAALGFWIASGSASENDEQTGLSHLLEHMLFRGSERYASLEIDQIFDEMGAELNAGTGKEMTSFYARVLDRHLERAFDVIADMVWRPALVEIEAEREVVLEEIAMYEDDPQDSVFDVLGTAVFGDHPLGRAIVGRAEVVGAAEADQLREFHAVRYTPPRIVIAAAGSVDHDEIVGWARQASAGDGHVGGELTPALPRLGAARARFQSKETEQYHVCVGGPGIPRDDERRYALRVLDNIIGGTSSSRLFQAVRERRGLAYAVFSFHNLYAHTGQVGVYVGTRPDNLQEALAVIGSELGRLASERVSDDELARARENVKGRLVLALESTTARMDRLGSSVLADMPVLSVDELIERIDAVTRDDVEALARDLFAPERLSAAGIGPEPDRFTRALEAFSPALAEVA